VRDTGEMFELVEHVKEISENINFYISIYFDIDARIGNIEFSKEYKIFAERAGREIIIGIKSFSRP
jgi:hypothetical protein